MVPEARTLLEEAENTEIPSGWARARLGDLGDFATSSVNKKKAPNEDAVHLVNYMDVYERRFIDCSLDLMRVSARASRIERSQVEPGDVLFTPSSETPDDIGHSAVVVEELPNTLHSYHTVRLRPNGQHELDRRFMGWFADAEHVRRQFERRATGTTRFTLNLKDFRDTTVLLPPLPEQKKIAEILSSVDDAIAATRKVIEQTKRVKKGLLQDLMTGGVGHTQFKQTKIGEIPEEWEVVRLEDVCAHITKGATPTTYGYEWVDPGGDGILFLRSECISEEGFQLSGSELIPMEAHQEMSRSEIRGGDVLVTITGNVGRVGQVPQHVKSANINQHIARVRVEDSTLLPDFVHFALQTRRQRARFETIITGLAYPQLSLKQIRETPVPVPSMSEQEEIVERLNGLQGTLASQLNATERLTVLNLGLMQDLLTGRVRVPVD